MAGRRIRGSRRCARTWPAAGIEAPECPDVRVDLWRKFVLFNAVSSTTAAARCRMGAVQATPELMALAEGLAAEAFAVGRALGVALPDGLPAEVRATLAAMPAAARASTAHDLEGGRPLEVDWICGAAVRLGREAGVDTPLSRAAHAVLAPWRDGAPR